jgi:hypothetical protein
MKSNSKLARAAFAATALTVCASAWSAVDVGVGVTIRQPGVYGRIEIGTNAPPPVIYRQPVVIAPPAVIVAEPPMYLYVPPGHAKKWRKHCHRYDACGRQVYFVREEWVQARYNEAHSRKGAPVYAQERGEDHGRGHGHGHGHGKGKHDD